jgi:hypothetical protein
MLKSIFGSIILVDLLFRKLEWLFMSHNATRIPARPALPFWETETAHGL